jgi:hypothetical protein
VAKRKATKRDPETGLTPQQLTAALMLGGGLSITKTAEGVGVDRVTIWRWMQIPAFAEESARMRDETVKAAKEHIRSSLLRAAEVAGEALDAMKPIYLKDEKGFAPVENVPDHGVRLRAAAEILDRAGVPRRVETEVVDAHKQDMEEITKRIRERK